MPKKKVTITPHVKKLVQEKADKRRLKKREALKKKKQATATGPKRKR